VETIRHGQTAKYSFPTREKLLAHVTGDEEDVLNQAKIAFSTGWYLDLRGEYKTAEKVVRMSVEGREKVLGPGHLDTASITLAWCWRARVSMKRLKRCTGGR